MAETDEPLRTFDSIPNGPRVARLLTTTPPTAADLLARVRRGGKGKGQGK